MRVGREDGEQELQVWNEGTTLEREQDERTAGSRGEHGMRELMFTSSNTL